MKTFFNILQTKVGIKNKYYPNEPFNDKINNLYSGGITEYILFLMHHIFYTSKKITQKSLFSKNALAKFTALNSFLENTFYKKELKENIFDVFTETQKHYYAFSRLARIYKLKKNPYIVTHDLMMNQLDPNDKLTFILIEEKSNYLFNINELINIIETAIGNSPYFFSEPLSPLNPYNNRELTNSTLYNVYFQMKEQRRVMPLLFHCFFIENFNKIVFSEEHEAIIREQSIKKYVFNSPHTLLYKSVIFMLNRNYYTRKLNIDENFPKNLLVNIFRPFLFYDYISNYYIKDTLKSYNAKELLYTKLKNFYKYNKSFGREMIKLTKQNNKIIKQEYVFNTNHLSFYDIPIIDQNDPLIVENSEYEYNQIINTPVTTTANMTTPVTIPAIVDIIIMVHNENRLNAQELTEDEGDEEYEEYEGDGEELADSSIS